MTAPRRIIVATTARTGSEMVCAAMSLAGGFGDPHEWLNLDYPEPRPHGSRSPAEEAEELEARLQRFLTGAFRKDGVDALKIMWTNMVDLLDIRDQELPPEFAEASWVYLRRRDTVAQTVSLSRAFITRQWHLMDDEAETVNPAYLDFFTQLADKAFIESQEAGWEAFFAQQGIRPFRLWYEDFLLAHMDCLWLMRNHCAAHTELLHPFPLDAIPVRRVGNRESREWRALLQTCLDHNLLATETPTPEHFLVCGFPLWIVVESVERTANEAVITVTVTNHGEQPASLVRHLWGKEWPVTLTVQWARQDDVHQKWLEGKSTLPPVLAPGEVYRSQLRTPIPDLNFHCEAYLLFVLEGRYAIRLLGTNTTQLPDLAINRPD